jgi:hypothetical protein
METLKAIEIDSLTGKSIERDLTAEELTNVKNNKKEFDKIEAERKAKTEARLSALAKLAALGLTEAEIASL